MFSFVFFFEGLKRSDDPLICSNSTNKVIKVIRLRYDTIKKLTDWIKLDEIKVQLHKYFVLDFSENDFSIL